MGLPVTSKRRDELREAFDATTPGPWRVGIRGYSIKTDDHVIAAAPPNTYSSDESATRWLHNAEFCAEAHVAMPDLLDEIEMLLAALAELGPKKHGFYCRWPHPPGECTCGADEHNAKVNAILEARR